MNAGGVPNTCKSNEFWLMMAVLAPIDLTFERVADG